MSGAVAVGYLRADVPVSADNIRLDPFGNNDLWGGEGKTLLHFCRHPDRGRSFNAAGCRQPIDVDDSDLFVIWGGALGCSEIQSRKLIPFLKHEKDSQQNQDKADNIIPTQSFF